MAVDVSTANPPRAAYVHVPFCAHRCGYCNFTLIAGRDELIETYLQALEIELSWLEKIFEVDTLFLGGGTPTHLPIGLLKRLLQIIMRVFPLHEDAEFSIEANPLDLEREKLQVLQDVGVNRLSIGGQSFHTQHLKTLERDHHPQALISAIENTAKKIPNVSLDLIFAIPGQTLRQWQADLQQAVQLPLKHVSTYGLTIEKGTTFWNRWRRGSLSEVEENVQREMYEEALTLLPANGFEHYEVSNYARHGFACRHNENYWLGGNYFAAGPGAARHQNGKRETNHRSVRTYCKRILAGESPVSETETLSRRERACELAIFALRRRVGVEYRWFLRQTGYEFRELFAQTLARYRPYGYFDEHEHGIRLSDAGLLISDSLWPDFLLCD